MQVERYDGSLVRQVLTGMITSTRVLNRLTPRWTKDGLFASSWENIIGTWCVQYHKKYKKAPGRHIEGLFQSWAEMSGDKETARTIGKFLKELSGRYLTLKKKLNPDFIVDQAGELFNRIAAKKLRDIIDGSLDTGRVDQALKAILKFKKVDVGVQEIIMLKNEGMWDNTFREEPEPIVKYPGELGEFFGRSLRRDRFVVFMAPMKRGKSFMAFDLAWRAMQQGNRVIYFQLGDLSMDEEMERVASRLTMTPVVEGKYRLPTELKITMDVPKVTKWEDRVSKERLSADKVQKAVERFGKGKKLEIGKGNIDNIKWSFHPTRSLGMDGVRAVIDGAVADGFHPDVVVLDYMDILAPPPGYSDDHRAAVNDNWMAARRLSQELRALVVSATQANAASFRADRLGMHHFSEDNRKFAHVTGMIGINQKEGEKEQEIYRLNWVVLRGEKYSPARDCFAAGCLAVAHPLMVSCFPHRTKDNDDENGED